MTTTRDLALLRLVALRLAGPGSAAPAEAVRWLLAAQAQEFPGALTSVALRTRAAGRAGVVAALDAGEIVRSWPMRGTLHFVVAADLPWLLELTAVRALRGHETRRRQVGLAEADLARARDLAAEALAGGPGLVRKELFAVWEAAGIATGDQRGAHLIYYLAQSGALCLGPVAGAEQRFVLVEEWVQGARRPPREEALAEFALRYYRSHGPATLPDLARWGKLTLTDARAGLAAVRDRLERVSVGDTDYFMDPETPALLDAHRERAGGVLLLPGFDEFMLGYGDRSAALPTEFAELIVPGGNGMFRPTVVAGGQVVGTWRHEGRGEKRTLAATPFTAFGAGVTEEMAKAYDGLP
jgi:hypothetical protein